jgi:uncharacterized membrane protein HdeD (DUF308 family)
MDSNENTARALEDVKVNVKVKLSGLWVALMFFYLYNDVISFFRRDTIEDVLSGELAGAQVSQLFLFGAAVLMAIPILMVFLSLTLPARANRWTNVIVGIFHAVVLIATVLVPGEIWAHYALYMALEALFIALIVWTAWRWPRREA